MRKFLLLLFVCAVPCFAQVSIPLRVTATPCGPPVYPCTPSNVYTGLAPTQTPFSGLGSANTCPGTNCGADNTVVMDPEPVGTGNSSGLFHNPIVRVTNSFSGCGNGSGEPACPATKQNVSFNSSNSGDDEAHWNIDDTMYWITDSGNTKYYYSFNPSTMASTLLCSNFGNSMKLFSGGSFTRTNNWQFYNVNNAGDTDTGTILSTWDLRNACPAQPTHLYDMSVGGSAFNAAAFSPCEPISVPNPVGFDGFQHFGECFSTSATQNTARYAVEYHIDGSGNNIVHAYDVASSTITSCTNSSCTSTAAICSNCGTGITDPGFFLIHNVKMSYDGQFMIVGLAPSSCSTVCFNGSSPYIWQPSTGLIYVACNAALTPPVGTSGSCSGHWHAEYSHWINATNTLQHASKGPLTSSSNVKFPAAGRPCPNTQDSHSGNENNSGTADDTMFLFSTTSAGSVGDYTECMENEIILLSPPSSVKVAPESYKRVAHSYYGGTVATPALNSCFAVQNAVAQISQTGKFALFTSSMNNQLGCMDGTTSCTSSSTSPPACNVGTKNGRGDVFIVKLQ